MPSSTDSTETAGVFEDMNSQRVVVVLITRADVPRNEEGRLLQGAFYNTIWHACVISKGSRCVVLPDMLMPR